MIATPTRPGFDDEPRRVTDLDLGPVVGMALEPFEDQLSTSLVDGADRTWTDSRLTGAAERCIARFAAWEADVTSDDLIGHGRQSAARYPRLGGVLHGRIAPGTRESAMLATGVERTIGAGYRAALATQQVASTPIEIVDAEKLWDAFVPLSYRIPRSVAAIAWDVCRFDQFWVNVLTELDRERDAFRLGNGHVSPLSRSIRGLSTVGVALAITERGGRYDRLVPGRRTTRGQRGALPPAPQITFGRVD